VEEGVVVGLSGPDDVALTRDARQRDGRAVVVLDARARGGPVEILGVQDVDDREHDCVLGQLAIDAERAGVLVPDAALRLRIKVRPVSPQPVLPLHLDLIAEEVVDIRAPQQHPPDLVLEGDQVRPADRGGRSALAAKRGLLKERASPPARTLGPVKEAGRTAGKDGRIGG